MMANYDIGLVFLLDLIPVIAAYIALDLAFRVRSSADGMRKIWLGAGAIAIGSAICLIQLIGILAYSLLIKSKLDPILIAIAVAIMITGSILYSISRQPLNRIHYEERFRSLVQYSSDIITILETNGKINYVSPSLERILGYKTQQIIGKNIFEYIHIEDVANVKAAFNSAIKNPIATVVIEYRVRHSNGTWIYLESVGNNLIDNPSIKGVVANSRNITKRKNIEENLRQVEEKYRSIFENAVEGIFQTTADGHYLTVNPMLARIYGYDSPAELIATITDITHQLYVDPNRRTEFGQILQEKDAIWGFESEVYRKDGKIIWISESARALRDSHGNLLGYEGTVVDITQRKQAEATIRYQAFHDILTGLPNRTLLNERLSHALATATKRRDKMAIMFLDLDRFKTINDTLGHAVGDQLLQNATQRLKSCLRVDDTIARWGGDEFTLLLPQINSIEDATKIAQRILDVLKPAFDLEGHKLHITSSIGIAIYPQHGEDTETLLRNADAALYRAKAEGRNNYQIYVPAMNSQASELLELENQLHQAIEQEEFILYYQPQINLHTGQILRMEALVRWEHPQQGQLLPKTFIQLAEENGLILPLGSWVLRTACAQNKAWQDAGLPAVRVAVNLSVRQLQQPTLVEIIAEILAETGLAPEFLELEITETAVMQNADFTREKLDRLVEMGCHITLDDFGSGYSSLNYLKTFPLHTLKIDESFVRDLLNNTSDAAIVSAIIALGRGLNLSVVAVGVETLEQLKYLQILQCEEMQGYLFSHPLPVKEATKLLTVKNPFLMGMREWEVGSGELLVV